MTKERTDDGGAAFASESANQYSQHHQSGMSLLEYFAGKALVGLLCNPNDEAFNNPVRTAEWSYDQADAMIAERNKRRDEGK